MAKLLASVWLLCLGGMGLWAQSLDTQQYLQNAQASLNDNQSNENSPIAQKYLDLVEALAEARSNEDALGRLEALESVLDDYQIGQRAQVVPSFSMTGGRWGLDIQKDPKSGDNTYYFVQEAVSSNAPAGTKIYLVIAQTGSSLSIFVNWGLYFDREPVVGQRLDGAVRGDLFWSLSQTGTTSYYPEDPWVFLSQILDSRELALWATPFVRQEIVLLFELGGLAELAEEHQGTLGWAEGISQALEN